MNDTYNTMFNQIAKSVIGSDSFLSPYSTAASRKKMMPKYPPCNMFKKEDNYIIELAVAGFAREDLRVEIDYDEISKTRVLTVTGEITEKELTDDSLTIFCQEIAARQFVRKYNLVSEFLEIEDVKLKDGILRITIQEHKPEKLKPHLLEIK